MVRNLEWLVNSIQEVIDFPLCIDSPDENALRAGLALAKTTNGKRMINLTTAEEKRSNYKYCKNCLKAHRKGLYE